MSVTVSPQEKVVGLTLRVMSGEALVTGVGVGAEVRVALTPRGVLKALGAREGDEAPEGAGLLVETGPAETEACCAGAPEGVGLEGTGPAVPPVETGLEQSVAPAGFSHAA